MATGIMPAQSPYGRARFVRPGRFSGAGFKPRHKQTRLLRPGRLRGTSLSLPTACAASPAQSPPCGVDPRHKPRRLSLSTACADSVAQSSPCAARSSPQQANKRLMETYPNSELMLTNWNHKHLTHPNSNSNPDSKPPSFSTACAGPPAQSPPCGFDPRHKPTRLSLSTACADSIAQSSPYGVPRHSPLAAHHSSSNRQLGRLESTPTPRKQTTAASSNRQLLALFDPVHTGLLISGFPVSNRSYLRLEINISPTKQRTEALSNRSNSGVFWKQDAGRMSAVGRTRSRMKGGGGTNEKVPTKEPARRPRYFNAPRFWRGLIRTGRRGPSS
jgi:hypothetical protein